MKITNNGPAPPTTHPPQITSSRDEAGQANGNFTALIIKNLSKMKTFILSFMLIFLVCISSCKKNGTVPINETQQEIVFPSGYTDIQKYVFLSKELIILMVKPILSLKTVEVEKLRQLNQNDLTLKEQEEVQKLIRVDEKKYNFLLTSMGSVVENHRLQNNLTKQQNYDYFRAGIKFKVKPHAPGTVAKDFAGCKAEAGLVFAATSLGCIALGSSGIFSVFVIPCTTIAVSQLTISLRDCLQQEYPKPDIKPNADGSYPTNWPWDRDDFIIGWE